MALIDIISNLKGPVFIKNDSDAEKELEHLRLLDPTPDIERQIKLVEAGIEGEKQIRFELENSHIPCYVLHDLYLEHEGLSAQIDYLIICRKCHYVIECKNLVGNIEIDSQGNFTRVFNYGKTFKKEGLYSPITQNERHIRLIKQIIRDKSKLRKLIVGEGEDDVWKSIVVLANPKTHLNNKFAKKEIKEKVIRADQLVNYIKTAEAASKNPSWTDEQMKGIAKTWAERCIENPKDYAERFSDDTKKKETVATIALVGNEFAGDTDAPLCQRCGVPMVKRIAKKGEHQGRQFWGCPNYPKCRNLVPIEE